MTIKASKLWFVPAAVVIQVVLSGCGETKPKDESAIKSIAAVDPPIDAKPAEEISVQPKLEEELKLEKELTPLLQEELLLLVDHGPDHPKVQAVRKQIELIRARKELIQREKP